MERIVCATCVKESSKDDRSAGRCAQFRDPFLHALSCNINAAAAGERLERSGQIVYHTPLLDTSVCFAASLGQNIVTMKVSQGCSTVLWRRYQPVGSGGFCRGCTQGEVRG